MEVRPLPKSLQDIAEKELNEVPSEAQEKVEHLREWLKKQPHLKCRSDDQWILTFLRGCKFSLQRTKDKLDAYCTMRTFMPEIFQDRDPFASGFLEFVKQRILVQYSPPEDSPHPIVTIMRVQGWDVNKFTLDSLIKMALMIVDLTMHTDDRYVVAGEHVVLDLKGFTSEMLLHLTPANVKRAVYCSQVAYPARFKGIHYLNSPGMFVTAFNAIKPILPEKINSRVRFYTEHEAQELYKHVPRKMLPKEYGGEAGTLDELADQLCKKAQSYQEWYANDTKYRSDESKRTVPLKEDGVFGPDGSFRQLTVD